MNIGDVELYVRIMGKLVKVSNIETSVEAVNAYMEKHKEEAVVAVVGTYGELILLANENDLGFVGQNLMAKKQQLDTVTIGNFVLWEK